MKFKMIFGSILYIGIICGMTTCAIENYSNNAIRDVSAIPIAKHDSGIKKFPSYDWGYEENVALASISANTPGSREEKQQAIIDCLSAVWDNYGEISIIEYFNGNYYREDMIEPTEEDYYILHMTVMGLRCEEEVD